MKSKNIWAILAIFLLLVVLPTASYFFLRSGVEARDLRYVDPFAYQNEAGDTIRPEFTDQRGDTLRSPMLEGKLKLSSFLFYRCNRFTYCDSIPYFKQRIQHHFRDEPDLQLLTYTIDPAHDTTAILKTWANAWNADSDKWHFVRGRQAHTYQIILGEYFGEVKYADGDPTLMQPDRKVVLVGRDGMIKGYYKLENEDDLEQVITAIQELLDQQQQSGNS